MEQLAILICPGHLLDNLIKNLTSVGILYNQGE